MGGVLDLLARDHPHSKRSRLANSAEHSDDDQLGALVCLIALINLYNRLNGITHQPAGDYTPGQWG